MLLVLYIFKFTLDYVPKWKYNLEEKIICTNVVVSKNQLAPAQIVQIVLMGLIFTSAFAL